MEIKDQLAMDIKSVMKMEDIADELVLMWSNCNETDSWTMEEEQRQKYLASMMISEKLRSCFVHFCKSGNFMCN